ncbi:MAG: Rap1a/Tai family immunity protein [Micavibrio sp.]
MILRFFILALLVCAVSSVTTSPAQAARFSGAYLIKICGVDAKGSEISPGAHAACQSYISGVVDYHNMLRSMKMAPEIDFCIPKNVSLNQLHLQVLQYLERNPQHDSFVAAPAVVMALYEKHPCSRRKKK